MELTRTEEKFLSRVRRRMWLDPGPTMAKLTFGLTASLGVLLMVTSFLAVLEPSRSVEGFMFFVLAVVGYNSYVATSLVRKLDRRLRDERSPV